MRILYWSDFFWPYIGGPEALSAVLLPALRDRGCEIIALTSHHHLDLPDEETFRGISVHRLPFHRVLANADVKGQAESLEKVLELKKRFKPDLIHIGSAGPSAWFHLREHRRYSAPVLATLQREVLPSEMNGSDSLLSELLRSADWVRTVSSAVLEQARALVPEIEDRSSAIYSFCPYGDAAYVDPGPANKRVLCLGRHVPVKGFDLALKAFELVRRRVPEARLIIGGDGPERAALQRDAAAMNLDDAVEFPGWIPPRKVSEIMRSVAVVLIPSRSEGLPTVAIQAARAGRPIVGTSVGGLAEIVIDRQTGLLAPSEDVPNMADALCELLENPDRAQSMGRQAAERADKSFSEERCIDSFIDLYRRLTGQHPVAT